MRIIIGKKSLKSTHIIIEKNSLKSTHIIIEKNSLKSTNYYRKKIAVEHELLAPEIRCRAHELL